MPSVRGDKGRVDLVKIKIDGPCTITIDGNAQVIDDEPPAPTKYGGHIAVDPHCHAHGSKRDANVEEPSAMMAAEDLHLITPLAWGYGSGVADRTLVTGRDDPASAPERIIHWDCEYSQTPSHKLGHLVTHGCPPHPTQLVNHAGCPTASTIPIAQWARDNGAIAIGMAHCQQWPQWPAKPGEVAGYPGLDPLQFCPYEAPVLAVLGLIDYLGVETGNHDGQCIHPGAWLLWKYLQRAGFDVALVGGSDFTCLDNPLGTMRTMVPNYDKVDYDETFGAIASGDCIVSTGANGFVTLNVSYDNVSVKPDEPQLHVPLLAKLRISVHTDQPGPVQLQIDGEPWTSLPIADGRATFVTPPMGASCFITARTPQFQTNAVHVKVGDTKIRGREESRAWLRGWIAKLAKAVSGGVFGDGAKDGLPYYDEAIERLI